MANTFKMISHELLLGRMHWCFWR